MSTNKVSAAIAAFLTAVLLLAPRASLAQNPVQWGGNAKQSISRAAEQLLPMLVWVKDGNNVNNEDDNDLEDAQEHCFRDPTVVSIIHKHFIPFRANRNSRFIEEANRLGLPTGFGLYCAVVTSDGKVIDQMGPGEVAQPRVFAARLNAAYTKYCDEVYDKDLRPVLEDLKSPKSKVRTAARAVWRLGISKADTAIIGLLAREDLTPSEKGRLYELLASLGTQACITTLLGRADEQPAAAALAKAEPGALEWLLPSLPPAEGEATATQFAAYTATAKVCRTTAMSKEWWSNAKPDARQKELDRVQARAATVLEYWRDQEGAQP